MWIGRCRRVELVRVARVTRVVLVARVTRVVRVEREAGAVRLRARVRVRVRVRMRAPACILVPVLVRVLAMRGADRVPEERGGRDIARRRPHGRRAPEVLSLPRLEQAARLIREGGEQPPGTGKVDVLCGLSMLKSPDDWRECEGLLQRRGSLQMPLASIAEVFAGPS